MKKHWKFVCRCMVFICILCICLKYIFQLIVPKFFIENIWPTTSTCLGFYKIEKNSADVLFFGSSHAASFFIPQELYNNYGITSYNLGCEQQNLVTSYFWLREALKYQHPEAVVLECYILFTYRDGEALNTDESCTRKAFDYMKWSQTKMEAVKTICSLDNKQSLLSYYLPNIRYHTRWASLSEKDFKLSEMGNNYELKGYTPLVTCVGEEDYLPFEKTAEESGNGIDMVQLMREYLEKITDLCKQENIPLILVKTPSMAGTAEKNITVQKYADENGLLYIDFNEKVLYKKVNYNFKEDNADAGHGNIWGGIKVTNYMGKVLKEQFGIEDGTDWQWEETKEYYKKILEQERTKN
ncbi:MAG: hypothetical protein K1W15_00840 [Lachnospiraceae bacterium]